MQSQKEIRVVTLMVEQYCRGKHRAERRQSRLTRHELCTQCAALLDYAKLRASKCPHGENKPFCSNCTIHCYKPDMRQRIRAVMRYSGPRMLFSHPVLAISHVVQTVSHKRKLKKQAREGDRHEAV